jgi:hypothetical protein
LTGRYPPGAIRHFVFLGSGIAAVFKPFQIHHQKSHHHMVEEKKTDIYHPGFSFIFQLVHPHGIVYSC